jgi:hypothetical protein
MALMPEPRDNADLKLRDHLLASEVDFRELMSSTLEGHTIEGGESVYDHLSRRVDALLAGEAVVFTRFELPDWHPLSPKYGGDPSDRFVLGPDDVVRSDESPEPRLKLNRAERRAAGWRGPGLNGNRRA